MATRQKVQIDIDARNRTKRAFDQVNQSLTKTQKATAALKKSFGFLSAGLGVAAVGKFVSSSQKATNQLVDFGKILGNDIEQLSEFTFAMEAAGVATGASTIALQRQTRRLGEASQGYGTAVKALDRLGLSANELAALNPTEAFDKISDGLLKIEDQSLRITTAFDLWDTEGVKLAGTLEEVDRFKKLAQESGAVITPEEAQAARDIRDAFSELRAETTSLGQNLTLIFGPVLEFGLEVIETIVFAFRKLTDGVIFLGQKIGLFDDALEQAERRTSGIVTNLTKAADPVQNTIQALRDGNEVLAIRERGLQDQADITQQILTLQRQINRELTPQEESGVAQQIQLRNELNSEIKRTADLEAKTQADRLKAEQAAADEIQNALDRQKDFADEVAATMTSSFSDAVIEGEKLSDVFDGLLKDLAQMVIRMAVLRPLAQSISGGIQPFIPQFATGTRNAPGGLALVGERGPELVNLPSGSQVIPNNKMGGNSTVVNVINAPPDTRVEETTQPDGTQMVNVILAEVSRSITSGGMVSSAIQSSFGGRQKAVAR